MHGWDSYHKEGRRHNSLPHGLLSIATEMRRAGHEITICDFRQYKGPMTVAKAVMRQRPEFVGCGAMTVDFGIACQFFDNIKDLAPEITTVIGGVHASICPEDAEKHKSIDYIVTGEAEWTLTAMADECFVGCKRVTAGESPDLDMLLPINRELVDYRDGELMHGAAWNSSYPYVTIMVGRGCPHKCNFCWPVSDTMFGKRVRQRSVQHVMWELKDLMRRYHPRYIEFIDDLLLIRKEWVDEFIGQYPHVSVDIPFNVAARADIICKRGDHIAALRDIGLDTMNVGLESGCQRHLDFLGKGVTVEQNWEAVEILKGLGIKIVGNIIHGIPEETPSETLETVRLAKECDFYSPSYLTPYPGCALYEEYGKKLLPTDYAKMHRHATNAKIEGVDYETIERVLKAEGLR